MTVRYHGATIGISYVHLCQVLEQSPFSGIVSVTASGRISFTNAKGAELIDLLANVITKGFTPSHSLISAVRRLED